MQILGEGLLQLFFPHLCASCGSDLLDPELPVCLKCMLDLPFTEFENLAENPVEKIFWGRVPLENASSHLYFNKDSNLQNLLHQLKYKGRNDLGVFLGASMGRALSKSTRFSSIDALVPLPLHASRERKRGYNQARVICEGISTVTGWPILDKVIHRTTATQTQTNRTRAERWQNMEGKFELKHPARIEGRHLLLIDDVITTGATLEACGQVLLEAKNASLSIASLAYALR